MADAGCIHTAGGIATDIETGTELAGYRVEGVLGRGGMGVVYLATDLQLKRRVALKILAPELAQDQAFRDRFVRESETAASLEDPNVVPIHEAGEADGQLFIAMRYVEGTDLGTLIREMGQLDPIRTASIVSQVASALDAAHERGLVHRDVKPANILISRRDRSRGEHVYLTDFGLIRRMAHATSLTKTGQFMGTIDYVAPEQIRGQQVDGRADVYSLGCVLYECLTGRAPFAGDIEVAVLYAQLEEPSPKPTALRPELPAAVDDVVAKAMAKQPQDRYGTAGALAEDAREALLGGAPAGTGPGPRLGRRKPRRRLLVAAAIVAVLAVIGATLPFVLGGHSGPPQASAVAVGSDSVAVLDAMTGRVVGDVPIGARPSAVAAGAGAVWVANATSGTVSHIDPTTRSAVQTIQVDGTPVALAVGFGAVWVVNADGPTVLQINPTASKVVSTITVGNGPDAVAVGAGGVWVANSLDDTVTRIDPEQGAVVGRIPVGSHPSAVVVEGQSVWVANSADGTVMQIDPGSNSVTRTVHVGNGPAALGAGSGVIWVANGLDGTASRIDVGSGSVTATVPVGDGPGSVAISDGSAWVANQFGGTVSRIGPAGRVTDTVHVGNAPQGIAVAGANLWVTVAAAGRAHRGGTLLLESTQAPDFLDPALTYAPLSWQILAMTNDGLLGFRRVGGPDGATIVPDLATTVPAPTDGERTFTFQLRPGLRYSNGRLVAAADFRSSMERLFKLHTPAPYYGEIVGGDACAKDPATCDLSRGVVTDDRSGTVTFHLAAPDPEFLYKLALPFGDVVPEGTPDPTPSSTVPATGPYEIQTYTPAHGKQEGTMVLVRNPQFHEWSAAAQPDGYPDRIVYTIGVDAEQVTSDVEQGRADMSLDSLPADRLQEVSTRFTNQVHTFSQASTYGITLNTNLPPFDDVRVRRAVNFAYDRGAAATANQPALPTCQLIPPNFPGYRPYCPYTLNPSSGGTWTGPDLARAQQLVAASHTAGTKVTVWATPAFPATLTMGQAFAATLNDLGYPTTLRSMANVTKYFNFIANSDNRVQAAGYGWLSDYPAASNFINLVRCLSFAPGSNGSLNVAQLCDPALDRRIQHALSVQATDPAAANGLWAAIDRQVTRDAPWVFVLNKAGLDFVSARVGNYQHNPQWGVLIDQLWVK